jgi:hypothetical protein
LTRRDELNGCTAKVKQEYDGERVGLMIINTGEFVRVTYKNVFPIHHESFLEWQMSIVMEVAFFAQKYTKTTIPVVRSPPSHLKHRTLPKRKCTLNVDQGVLMMKDLDTDVLFAQFLPEQRAPNHMNHLSVHLMHMSNFVLTDDDLVQAWTYGILAQTEINVLFFSLEWYDFTLSTVHMVDLLRPTNLVHTLQNMHDIRLCRQSTEIIMYDISHGVCVARSSEGQITTAISMLWDACRLRVGRLLPMSAHKLKVLALLSKVNEPIHSMDTLGTNRRFFFKNVSVCHDEINSTVECPGQAGLICLSDGRQVDQQLIEHTVIGFIHTQVLLAFQMLNYAESFSNSAKQPSTFVVFKTLMNKIMQSVQADSKTANIMDSFHLIELIDMHVGESKYALSKEFMFDIFSYPTQAISVIANIDAIHMLYAFLTGTADEDLQFDFRVPNKVLRAYATRDEFNICIADLSEDAFAMQRCVYDICASTVFPKMDLDVQALCVEVCGPQGDASSADPGTPLRDRSVSGDESPRESAWDGVVDEAALERAIRLQNELIAEEERSKQKKRRRKKKKTTSTDCSSPLEKEVVDDPESVDVSVDIPLCDPGSSIVHYVDSATMTECDCDYEKDFTLITHQSRKTSMMRLRSRMVELETEITGSDCKSLREDFKRSLQTRDACIADLQHQVDELTGKLSDAANTQARLVKHVEDAESARASVLDDAKTEVLKRLESQLIFYLSLRHMCLRENCLDGYYILSNAPSALNMIEIYRRLAPEVASNFDVFGCMTAMKSSVFSLCGTTLSRA